jgi:hypothetical protein
VKKLKEAFHRVATRVRNLAKPRQAAAPAPKYEPPAREILTHGAGKIVPLNKKLNWKP